MSAVKLRGEGRGGGGSRRGWGVRRESSEERVVRQSLGARRPPLPGVATDRQKKCLPIWSSAKNSVNDMSSASSRIFSSHLSSAGKCSFLRWACPPSNMALASSAFFELLPLLFPPSLIAARSIMAAAGRL